MEKPKIPAAERRAAAATLSSREKYIFKKNMKMNGVEQNERITKQM